MRSMLIAFSTLTLSAGLATAQVPTARQEVLEAKHSRPTDPWPRGQGHVVLALPGSLENAKSYHEPGGSFSPAFRSFGVSLWITNTHGAILQTSDSIPIAHIQQHFVWHDGGKVPSILTETGEYLAEWSVGAEPGISRLQLNPKLTAGYKMMVVIRSVGPAGSAIESMQWDKNELLINGRYKLQLTPSPVSLYVGPEGTSGWITAATSSTECHGQRGWCYARLELPPTASASLAIVDTFPLRDPGLAAHSARSSMQISLPDARFGDSLDAQVAHLMMGLVDNQTRPGDPNQYPLPWLRDGAYEVVALARAGELDTTRELARYFAEKDFFGGFGAEGDNPGLALWALGEVSSRLHSSDYDKFLWPHVYRKAEFILGMRSTKEPIRRIFAGIIVPEHQVEPDLYDLAVPGHDGLVAGRMDLHYPALYTTAASYNGLLSAVEIAARLGHYDEARRWGEVAAELRKAWNAAFNPTDPEADERTFISGVWPTWIAADHAQYESGLDRQWKGDWDTVQGSFRQIPLWTYFTFATAHQYLLLDKPETAWQTLRWFWKQQPSPGLYSWWEGNGEENTFHEWEYARGWTHPSHVTPHYWAAAECLLLQIDMLAYIDRSQGESAIVIGAGLPAEWTRTPMYVHGLITKLGRLDWDWDGKAMVVKFHGGQIPVRLGGGFPRDAKVEFIELGPQ